MKKKSEYERLQRIAIEREKTLNEEEDNRTVMSKSRYESYDHNSYQLSNQRSRSSFQNKKLAT